MRRIVAAALLLLCAAAANGQQKTLTIVKAGPVGEIAKLAEANEIRVVFSEPMVVVGKIPKDLSVPWFHIAPAVKGTFRWSGTTTLIFTPAAQLPYATKFDVTIGADATSVAGNKLGKAYKWSFTTPTIQLVRTNWYRRGRKADAPVVVVLRFNQPVEADNILQHLQLRTKAHDFKEPSIPAAGAERLKRLEPQALTTFEAKKAKAREAAQSNGAPVFAFLTNDWDKKSWLPSPDLVVLETKPGVPPETNVQVFLDDKLARRAADQRSGRAQEFTIELDRAFFVDSIACTTACNPEANNSIELRSDVSFKEMRRALSVTDITDPAKETKLQPTEPEDNDYDSDSRWYSLDELGYSLQPARKYAVRIDPSLTASDGQKLGYTWMAVIENARRSAFTSFGDGHGVWEADGGSVLPFYARNFRTVKQWIARLPVEDVVQMLEHLERSGMSLVPSGQPVERKLTPAPDKIQSFGLDLKSVLNANGRGIVWAAIEEGEPIPGASTYAEPGTKLRRATVVQVTNLGISIKDSPRNALILVTRLDDGVPVPGAKVHLRDLDNKVVWSGTTDAQGIAVADVRNLRAPKKPAQPVNPDEMPAEDNWDSLWNLRFVAFAEKDGDIAYAASNWHDGILPWDFGLGYDLAERDPLLRGTVFTDRGVYKLGEEVHAKAILRSDTPDGMQLMPAGTKVTIVAYDTHAKKIDERVVSLNAWSSAEWTFRVPADGPLGSYHITAVAAGQKLEISGDFLVAAYRRPDFRVDVDLTGANTLAGTKLDGKIGARYLFGAPMGGRDVAWTTAKRNVYSVPTAIRNKFPEERYSFLGCDDDCSSQWNQVGSKEEKLDPKGELRVPIETNVAEGRPVEYRLEAQVTDVSRQVIAGRDIFRVDPAPWYIGVRTPPFFGDTTKGLDTDIVAVNLDGNAVAGVTVNVELKQIQWSSVRRAEGNGFYTWDTERKEIDAGTFTITTRAQPVPLKVPLAKGGEYLLIATASDAEGRTTRTRVWFYVMGAGYTAWERFDHNRIDLVPEKKNYRPGETARIMIKSPWERATALVTTEREAVRTWKEFELTSTQQTIEIPITEREIPNIYVSVLLIKGRTKEADTGDGSDPGKPSFRLGYTELFVEDESKRLKVDVKANREEYRPATKAKIEVDVRDVKGAGTQSEVTLWAVDYGVLSLTGYETPDVLESIYLHKNLQVSTEDSRQKIISRRVITPKGAEEGGGGGRDPGPGTLRKDFRVLAFWLGSLVTDAKGRARTEVTLPESLTTYRIMAVAADKQSRFGWAQNEIRINKPLMLTPAFPRFLAVGDKALFGSVVHSQLKAGGTATVTVKSLDPNVIAFTGESQKRIPIGPNASSEVRFDAIAKSVGTARIQMTVSMAGETDAFEDVIPVRVFVTPETVAAYGEATTTQAKETLNVPTDIVPGFGGLHVDLSSTAMVGLGEGARYLVEYPYGCAEQRSSATLALMLAADLGDAFKLPGIDAASARTRAQTSINQLARFQCGEGGFSFWPGECGTQSPYLTAYVLHVFQRAQKLNYTVDASMMTRGYDYLDRSLNEPRPTNEGWMPAYTAWQAFAVKVLTEGGRNEDSHINRLLGYVDRMPLFGISHLADALMAKNDRGPRLADLHRRLTNAILPEGGFAHVEELNDPYLLYLWSSTVRTNAIVLGTLVRHGQDEELVKRMVRWLMRARKDGRWGNTQENAWAMGSLVDYYRKYEAATPDFNATMSLGANAVIREPFRGRSTEAKSRDIPIVELPRGETPVTFDRQGTGTLFYMMRLRYAPAGMLAALDQGFSVSRTYDTGKSMKAGQLIRVTIKVRNTKERRFVAITDPIPAGTEPVESWFATTASALAQEVDEGRRAGADWTSWWRRGGFDHVERHDDRIQLFATRLGEGTHEFTYMLRATTAGTFVTAPLHAEQMYEPEVFGRTASEVVEVRP